MGLTQRIYVFLSHYYGNPINRQTVKTHNAAFHQGLHFLLRKERDLQTKQNTTFFFWKIIASR